PYNSWISDTGSGELIIDLGKKYMLNGIGYYHHYLDYGKPELVAQMLGEYQIEVSENGQEFKIVAEGMVRSFGGEQIIRFQPIKGRFVKICALKSVGGGLRILKYKNARVAIGNISVFEVDDCENKKIGEDDE
ncbi:MAG: discoidin domain-containing protein, partial [Oscillospiraceae bacterium]